MMIGPSHGNSGPDMTLLVQDPGNRYVRIRKLRIKRPEDAYGLAFSGQQVTTRGEGTTLIALKGVRPEKRNMSLEDLSADIRDAMSGVPGHMIHMDSVSLLYQLPVPDVTVRRLAIEPNDGCLPFEAVTFEPPRPAHTHPIESFSEPHSCTDHWVRKALRDLVSDAVRAYLDLPDAKGWTFQEFVAGYLMEHGTWLDLNHSEKDVRPVSEWLVPQGPDDPGAHKL